MNYLSLICRLINKSLSRAMFIVYNAADYLLDIHPVEAFFIHLHVILVGVV